MMRTFGTLCMLLGAIVITVLLALVGCAWIYLWTTGLCDSIELWWGWPWYATAFAVIAVIVVIPRAMFLVAILGAWATYHQLHWPLWESLLIFVPTLAFAFLTFILAGITAFFALIAAGFTALFSGRR